MQLFTYLDTEEVVSMINNGDITFAESIKIQTTPKKYVVLCPNKCYATSDLALTFKERIAKDYPKIKPDEIFIIDIKKFRLEVMKVMKQTNEV